MGKKLIIPGADFSANAIYTPHLGIKVAAGKTATILASTNGSTPIVYTTRTAGAVDEYFSIDLSDYLYAGYDGGYILSSGRNTAYENSNKESILEAEIICDDFTSLCNAVSSCWVLTSLTIRNSKGKLVDISDMCNGCNALATMNFDELDTSNVTKMGTAFSKIFANEIDISRIDTTSVISTGLNGIFNTVHASTIRLGEKWIIPSNSYQAQYGSIFGSSSSIANVYAPSFIKANMDVNGTTEMKTAYGLSVCGSSSIVLHCKDGNATWNGSIWS